MAAKKLTATPDVLDVLKAMTFTPQPDGTFSGVITSGALDRALYTKVNKFLETMGGQWARKEKAHIFPDDPRLLVEGLLDTGEMTFDNGDYFPAPPEVVRRMVAFATEHGTNPMTSHLILEPSAGEGAICDELVRMGYSADKIVTCELDPKRRAKLADKGYFVIVDDFFDLKFSSSRACILMNPPFSNSADVDHVMYAWQMLRPNGFLVSVMADGQTWHSDRQKFVDFRKLVDTYGATEKLPKGSFKSSGTMFGTRLVYLRKDNGKRGVEPGSAPSLL